MKPARERKLLQASIAPVTLRGSTIAGQLTSLLFGIGLVVLFLVIFRFSGSIGLFGTVALCTAIGWLLGFMACWRISTIHWPYLQRHLSAESIAARLAQLG
jgi:hypothetical protein